MLPVAVVGGGPVGMCAALAVAEEGLPVVVLERNPRPMPDWRASTFHAPTLELLGKLGVVDDMLAEGLVVPRYQFRDRRAGLVAEFDFGLLADETAHPYRLQLNQQRLVAMLFERLAVHPGVELRFGEQVVGAELHPDGVSLTLASSTSGGAGGNGGVGGTGSTDSTVGTHSLDASFLLGADGASSTVRRALGIAFEGFTYEERFLIVSTSVDLREFIPDLAPVNYIADPEEWLFILRTPESWRVLWPVESDVPDEQALSPHEIERHLQAVAARPEPYPVLDRQIYAVNQRVAEVFRLGRAMLLGDAAHINSPVGGVGLNSGIHDAIDASIRLGRIARGESGPDEELEVFAERRRRVALEYVQTDTERNTQRLKERDESVRADNIAEIQSIAGDPERQRSYLRRVSLLESVQRFGIGTPRTEDEARALSARTIDGDGLASPRHGVEAPPAMGDLPDSGVAP